MASFGGRGLACRAVASRSARTARYPPGPLLRATSLETVDTDRPSPAAITVRDSRPARPREIDSRSSNDNRNGGRALTRRGRVPPDCLSQ